MSTEAQASTSSLPDEAAADNAAIHRRLNDVESYQIPRVREAKSMPLLQEYEEEINEALDHIGALVRDFALSAEEYDTSREQAAVREVAAGTSQKYSAVRQAVRLALLYGRRNIAALAEASAREELSLGFRAEKARKERSTGGPDDKLMTVSQDVTDVLRRTTTLMSQELEKSAFSSQMLDESSSTLTALSSEYTSFSQLVKSSGHLIRTMERADLIDKAMVFASLLFFLACVLYILKVRIWDRGVSVLAFAFRLFGFGRGRSKESVMKALEMAQKAKASSSLVKTTTAASPLIQKAQEAITAAFTSSDNAVTAATTAAVSVASEAAAAVSDMIQEIVGEEEPVANEFHDRQNSRPVEHVEL